MNSTFVATLFLGTLGVFICSGLKDRKSIASEEQYFFGEKLSWVSFGLNAFGTNFSFITGAMLMVLWAYLYGFWPLLWTIGTGVLGILLFTLPATGPTGRSNFLKQKFDTLHHLLAGEDAKLRRIAGCVTFVTLAGFIIGESFIFSQYFASLIKWHPAWILACAFSVSIINGWLSGYKAAVKSDYFQVCLIGLGALVLFGRVFSAGQPAIENAVFKETFSPTPAFFIPMLIIINGLSQFSAMDMWQRARATESVDEVRKGGAMGAFIFLVITLILVGCGILLRAQDNAVGAFETDPFKLLNRISNFPGSPVYEGAMVLFFLAAYLTTLDSLLMALGNTWTMDIMQIKDNLQKSKRHTAVVSVISALIAVCLTELSIGGAIVDYLIIVFSISILLVPSIFFKTWFREKPVNNQVFEDSILFGAGIGVAAILYMLYKGNSSDMANYVPILCFFASWFAILVRCRKGGQINEPPKIEHPAP